MSELVRLFIIKFFVPVYKILDTIYVYVCIYMCVCVCVCVCACVQNRVCIENHAFRTG